MKATKFRDAQRPWTRAAAEKLLDMSGGLPEFRDIGARQLDAAVALHRMLLAHGCAYLADEVGMGKTYVALATVALFRYLRPEFRVLYLAPSANVLQKWHGRELPAFVRDNVRHADMRVRGMDGRPPLGTAACMNVDAWVAQTVQHGAVGDVFVPLSALSFQLVGESPDWFRRVKRLAEHGNVEVNLTGVERKHTFKDRAAEIVNVAIPYYDLVVIDEAHLLKNGAGAGASDRAQFLARALGAAAAHGGTRKFGAALLLSGTPFDRDLMQLSRQFELFAPAGRGDAPAPHEGIKALAGRRRTGEPWHVIQAGLKPYMVRRVQKLKVGDMDLSRNQYRRELRSEAGISLADDSSADALRQRIFTAVVQKRLIEHVDGEHGGHFPMAMFSSWEAYSPTQSKRASAARPVEHADTDDAPQRVHAGDALDIGENEASPQDARALDGALVENVVGSYREVFDREPPHPKLESEAGRLAAEAFDGGFKQLVFVRRLKSVDDLYLRLNEAYDTRLLEYLRVEGMAGCPGPLMEARRQARSLHSHQQPVKPTAAVAAGDKTLEEPPAHGDTLFSWFFRGELDESGQSFVERHDLRAPSLLRERLRDPVHVESIIGELDWRNFLADQHDELALISVDEIATEASKMPGPASALMRYRRLQAAWAHMQAQRLPSVRRQPFLCLHDHLSKLVYGPDASDVIDSETAASLLKVPTVALALHRAGLGGRLLPQWARTWRELSIAATASGKPTAQRLVSLDLQREVMFALLRLDHPFIDLYLGWRAVRRGQGGHVGAELLVERIVQVCSSDPHGERFGTASILRNLADSWEQVAKTNFADLLSGSAGNEGRSEWRRSIGARLSPFAPVEWASGQNTDSRGAIARRFRMPGYPMVLVSTSVLQEGEDLHVNCDQVTHFGISGSPIGIEQKNGRVDRIGSRAQRRLLAGHAVADAGIQVRFPHLTESLEWYQIRDLSLNINEYLRSIHEVGAPPGTDSARLADTMADRTPIPRLLSDSLKSPFEPQWMEAAGDVLPQEVGESDVIGHHRPPAS